MNIFKKIMFAVAILFVTFGADAQLNGTYWAPSKCFKLYDNGRYEYIDIMAYDYIVMDIDTLTRGDYQILGDGNIIKFDTNPTIEDIWDGHMEIIVQESPSVPSDSIEIVFDFPLIDSIHIFLSASYEYRPTKYIPINSENLRMLSLPDSIPMRIETRSEYANISYGKNKINSIIFPYPPPPYPHYNMKVSFRLVPYNLSPQHLTLLNLSSKLSLASRLIEVNKPYNRVIIRNVKDSDNIFNNVQHDGEYGLISGDTIIYKNSKYVKREYEFDMSEYEDNLKNSENFRKLKSHRWMQWY